MKDFEIEKNRVKKIKFSKMRFSLSLPIMIEKRENSI